MPLFPFQSNEKLILCWYPVALCALVMLPMLAFSAILIVLVYIYDWQRRPDLIKELSLTTGLYADVYYVDLSATKLITVASLSSSTVLTLTGSFMTLLSYPVAADMIWNSRLAFTNMLPNPAQLALLVDLLDGKKVAIFQWIASVWSGKSAENKSLWMVELAVALQVFITGSCLAIAGIDTWLHLSTASVTMPYFESANPLQAGAAYQYSRTLYESCWDTNPQDQDLPCSIKTANEQVQIVNQQQIDSLLLNSTSAETNLYLDQSTGYAYLGPPSTQEDSTQNSAGAVQYPQFSASTLAMLTSCAYVDCGLTPSTESQDAYAFSCPGGFSKDATVSWFETGPWYQRAGEDTSYTGLAQNYTPDVGLQWGLFVHLDNFTFLKGSPPHFTLNTVRDPVSGEPSSTFVLQCNSSLAISSYLWANNTLVSSLKPNVANRTVFDIALGPFLSQGPSLDFPTGSLMTFRDRLGLNRGKSAIGTIAQFDMLMSGIGLSFLGASVGPAAASSLLLPNSTILTEVPKLPLFALVALNLWYAGLALCLCILACFLLARGDQGRDIKAVRELLCVTGLTRAAVSNHRSVQGEDVRVGVIKRDGKWHLKIWPATNDAKEEGEGLLQPDEDAVDISNLSLLTERGADRSFSSRSCANSAIVDAGPMLGDDSTRDHEEPSVSPVSPISYNNALFTNDQDERRRISRGLEWADGER